MSALNAVVALLVVASPQGGGDDARMSDVRPALRAEPVTGAAPTIDGRLQDAAWSGVPTATGFRQMRPDPGEPASQPTDVRVLYDQEAVYVGMRLFDTDPAGIAAQLGRRDASGIYSDWAHVLIDSYHDRRTAFRFSVNPEGVQKDVLHYDDFNEDLNWDGVWTAAATVDDEGWTAEFRIPLSQLRFSPNGDGEVVWGINFGREIARNAEWSWWAPILPDIAGMVSAAGELRGLHGLEAPRRLEVLPYTVGRLAREPGSAANPFYRENDMSGQIGANLKYGITSNLTLSATINPDFGQVEADPSVVNLSAFETFFPERRPFFVEGANIFDFGIGFDDGSGESLFYSRRIGRSPQRGVSQADGFVEGPDATTIAAAGKISGRTSSGWSIGVLDAVTTRETAQIVDGDGLQREEAIEPLTNYGVARAVRDFNDGRSAIGGIFTSAHRSLAPALDFLRSQAYTAGIDARHRLASGDYEVSGWLVGSHVAGSPAAIERTQRAPARYYQRPDADHLALDPSRTSLSGLAGNVWASKIGGPGHWRWGVGGHFRTPGFEVNDIGFQRSADQALAFANLRYHQFEPVGPFNSFTIGINPSASWDFGGELMHRQVNLWSGWQFRNNWNIGFWSSRAFEGVSTGTLRGGPSITRPGAWRGNVWAETDRRKPVSVNVYGFASIEDESGTTQRNGGAFLMIRPSGRFDLRLGPNMSFNDHAWQYVGQPEDGAGRTRYVFGHLEQRTVSMTTRLSYTFTPTLSLQLYAQPFVSAGDYRDYREVADPRAPAFHDRFRAFDDALTYDAGAGSYAVDTNGDGTADFEFGDPDFNFKEMRSNAVLRWEYAPGSTLFLVWSTGRTRYDPYGTFDLGRDLDGLFGAAGSNIFMVKLNYWLDV